jgi:hypothetical protein
LEKKNKLNRPAKESVEENCGNIVPLLDGFAKLQKASIGFVMSVCPSIHREQLGSYWADFGDILYLSCFENLLRKLKFH